MLCSIVLSNLVVGYTLHRQQTSGVLPVPVFPPRTHSPVLPCCVCAAQLLSCGVGSLDFSLSHMQHPSLPRPIPHPHLWEPKDGRETVSFWPTKLLELWGQWQGDRVCMGLHDSGASYSQLDSPDVKCGHCYLPLFEFALSQSCCCALRILQLQLMGGASIGPEVRNPSHLYSGLLCSSA